MVEQMFCKHQVGGSSPSVGLFAPYCAVKIVQTLYRQGRRLISNVIVMTTLSSDYKE